MTLQDSIYICTQFIYTADKEQSLSNRIFEIRRVTTWNGQLPFSFKYFIFVLYFFGKTRSDDPPGMWGRLILP